MLIVPRILGSVQQNDHYRFARELFRNFAVQVNALIWAQSVDPAGPVVVGEGVLIVRKFAIPLKKKGTIHHWGPVFS